MQSSRRTRYGRMSRQCCECLSQVNLHDTAKPVWLASPIWYILECVASKAIARIYQRGSWSLSNQTPLMPNICYTYIHFRMKLDYAVAALGFFVPYFDLDVILLPTPPYTLSASALVLLPS